MIKNKLISHWEMHPLRAIVQNCYECWEPYCYGIPCRHNGEYTIQTLPYFMKWERLQVTDLPDFIRLLHTGESNFYSKHQARKSNLLYHKQKIPTGFYIATAAALAGYEGRAGEELLQWLLEMTSRELSTLLIELYVMNNDPVEAWDYFAQIQVELKPTVYQGKQHSYYERHSSLTNAREELLTDIDRCLELEKWIRPH